MMTTGSRVPLEEIYSRDGGHVYDVPDVIVQPADPATRGHMDLFPAGLAEELQAAAQEADNSLLLKTDGDFPYLLISRRMKNNYNSTGPELSFLAAKGTTNPAYINPEDLAALNIDDGEIGANTNRLINNLDHPEKYSGMARQSAIAIKLCKTG